MRTFLPKNVNVIPENAECVFKGEIFDVYQWEQEMFDGSYATFEMIKRPDTVQIAAVKDDKLVILKQMQPNTDWFYDLPSGRHDVESETELEAAKRELLEETGMRFANWKLIRIKPACTSKLEWIRYVFLATDFIDQVEQNLEAGEKIEVMLKNFDEVHEMANKSYVRFIKNSILSEVDSMDELLALPDLREV